MNDAQCEIALAFSKALLAATDSEREDMMSALAERNCLTCGGPAPCACWNDE